MTISNIIKYQKKDFSETVTLEERIIIDCTLKEEGCWSKFIDIGKLTKLSMATKTYGFLFEFCKGMPEKIKKDFKKLALKGLSTNEILKKCAIHSSSLLGEDILHSIVKGTVLAHHYYGSPHLRPSGDVDIMVSEHLFEDAIKRMQKKGFTRLKKGGFKKWATLYTKDYPVSVDIFTPSTYGISERIFSYLIKKDGILTFSFEGHIITALSHIRKNAFMYPLTEIKDIEVLMKKGGVDLIDVEVLAGDYDLSRVFKVFKTLYEIWSESKERKISRRERVFFDSDSLKFMRYKNIFTRVLLEKIY